MYFLVFFCSLCDVSHSSCAPHLYVFSSTSYPFLLNVCLGLSLSFISVYFFACLFLPWMSLVFALWSVSYPLPCSSCLFVLCVSLSDFLFCHNLFVPCLRYLSLFHFVTDYFHSRRSGSFIVLTYCVWVTCCVLFSHSLFYLPLSFFPPLCELWLFVTFSPFVGLTFYLFSDSGLPSAVSTLSLGFPFSTYPFCLSWLIFILLSCSVCLSVSLCDLPFQCLSSLCSPILLLFFFYPLSGFSVSSWVCVSLFHILQSSFLIYFLWTCTCIPMCACLCMFVTKGCPNPFSVGAECLLSK